MRVRRWGPHGAQVMEGQAVVKSSGEVGSEEVLDGAGDGGRT